MIKGAPFTYDLKDYTEFVKALKTNNTSPIPFRIFAHEQKDPAFSPFPILPQHRIIIIEGLYVLLSEPGWLEVAEQLDVSIYVDTDMEVARQRCIKRNFAAGLVSSLEATIKRGTCTRVFSLVSFFASRLTSFGPFFN